MANLDDESLAIALPLPVAAQEVRAAPFAYSLPYLLCDVPARQVRGQRAGGGDGSGGGRAVRYHHGAAEPEQRGAAIVLGVEAAAELAKTPALQHRAKPGGT